MSRAVEWSDQEPASGEHAVESRRNPRDLGIYPAGIGRWRVVVSTGRRRANGRYGQLVRIVGGTRTDARRLRDRLRADVSREAHTEPAREALGVYLQAWLERIAPPHGSIKVTTWKSYEKHVRVYLLADPISERSVGDLGTDDADDLFRRRLDRGLSPATVQSVCRTLRAALNAYPRVTANVAKLATGPRMSPRRIDKSKLWTPDQAKRFLAHVEEHEADIAALVRLALDSGARIGELLALRWSDIDMGGHVVTVSRTVSTTRMPSDQAKLRFDTPKNGKTRKVDIDGSTVAALAGLRDRQSAEPVADVGGLVFRRPTSEGFLPWRPDSPTHAFQRLSKAAKVPVAPFHYLRHDCASWLLEAGLDVVSVCERLGHSSPDVTLRIYSHALPGRQRELARAIGAALS